MHGLRPNASRRCQEIVSQMKTTVSAALAALAVFAANPAQAITVSEAEHGEYSKIYNAPTVFGDDVSAVSGTGKANHFDFLHFSGLSTGAQTVAIDFGYIPDGTTDGRTANLIWRDQPFTGAWGTYGGSISLHPGTPTTTLTLSLGDSFAGDLYLGLMFYSGTNITYTITGTVFPAEPPAVPLPAGLLLGLSAIGALGFAARRRA